MRVSPSIYNDTITVINKLDAKDAALASDAYYPTVIRGCMWSDSTARTVDSSGTVAIATAHNVQIPERENYRPYREWSKAESRDEFFTVRNGDFIVKGEVTDPITSRSELNALVQSREPDAFQVQSFRDLTHGEGFNAEKRGWLRFAEVLSIEG